jgi:hypothetical protein
LRAGGGGAGENGVEKREYEEEEQGEEGGYHVEEGLWFLALITTSWSSARSPTAELVDADAGAAAEVENEARTACCCVD